MISNLFDFGDITFTHYNKSHENSFRLLNEVICKHLLKFFYPFVCILCFGLPQLLAYLNQSNLR